MKCTKGERGREVISKRSKSGFEESGNLFLFFRQFLRIVREVRSLEREREEAVSVFPFFFLLFRRDVTRNGK